MYRASCREGPSFSPPIDRRARAWASVSVAGTPSEKTRTRRLSWTPLPPWVLPTMSSVSIASILRPSTFAFSAQWAAPISPCSSPGTARKTSVASKWYFDITLASSIEMAVPEASSLAPGASISVSDIGRGIES